MTRIQSIAFLLLILSSHSSWANDCLPQALALLDQHYPAGKGLLESIPEGLNSYALLHCDSRNELINSLSTVIHETQHSRDALESSYIDQEAFLLNNGKIISIPHPPKSVPRSVVLEQLTTNEKTNESSVNTYLTGSAGDQGFESLVREINAYTRSLDARIHLPRLNDRWRTNEAAELLMSIDYLVRYYQYAKIHEHSFYENFLMSAEVKTPLSELLKEAFKIYHQAEPIEDVMLNAKVWEEILQHSPNQETLKELL